MKEREFSHGEGSKFFLLQRKFSLPHRGILNFRRKESALDAQIVRREIRLMLLPNLPEFLDL